MKVKDIKDLVKIVTSGRDKQVAYSYQENNYSYNDLHDLLRDELKGLASDYNSYRRNKLTIFEIIQTGVDTILPNKVLDVLGGFADIQFFAQGKKPQFKRKTGKNRAKSFVTRVGLSGVYETFRLDRELFDIETYAFGGAAQMELERFLDGTVDFGDLLDVIVEGLEDSVYREIEIALVAAIGNLPTANVAVHAGFDDVKMTALLNVVRAYGPNAIIYCTSAFASTITPTTAFIGDADKSDVRNQGYIGRWKGADILILPQSFEDESNTTKVINDQYAYILPTGQNANEKSVKIAFEGETLVDEYKNRDRSIEIQAYRKFGVGLINNSHWGSFQNTAL